MRSEYKRVIQVNSISQGWLPIRFLKNQISLHFISQKYIQLFYNSDDNIVTWFMDLSMILKSLNGCCLLAYQKLNIPTIFQRRFQSDRPSKNLIENEFLNCLWLFRTFSSIFEQILSSPAYADEAWGYSLFPNWFEIDEPLSVPARWDTRLEYKLASRWESAALAQRIGGYIARNFTSFYQIEKI